ncbi:hypothetical protein THAOC_00714 [Thalassiosira oceanica]|uniref:Uncharacterized protein n=1 Tax=Thalassiosira oceanica TaxID=159749 RepID=K0TNW1_THAOC|nr:hypothetical protein THAOC_00714 [Thalassiosira oceanica]|eukprot:EJK77456.1 hypothetical protein THAOC_00714 [Thalassiosira oceanica]
MDEMQKKRMRKKNKDEEANIPEEGGHNNGGICFKAGQISMLVEPLNSYQRPDNSEHLITRATNQQGSAPGPSLYIACGTCGQKNEANLSPPSFCPRRGPGGGVGQSCSRDSGGGSTEGRAEGLWGNREAWQDLDSPGDYEGV